MPGSRWHLPDHPGGANSLGIIRCLPGKQNLRRMGATLFGRVSRGAAGNSVTKSDSSTTSSDVAPHRLASH